MPFRPVPYAASNVKRALLIVLAVVILLTGIPVVMGMGAASCPACSPGVLAGGCVAAILTVVAALCALALALQVRRRDPRTRSRLFATVLDPPPQIA